MKSLRDNRAHEIAPTLWRSVPCSVERLHVTTGTRSQRHLDAGRARPLGYCGRLTQSDGDF